MKKAKAKVKVKLHGQVIHLEGDLLFANVTMVWRKIKTLFLKLQTQGVNKTTVDLTQITHVDSAAVALLCNVWRHAQRHKQVCEFISPPVSLVNIAKLVGMSEILELK